MGEGNKGASGQGKGGHNGPYRNIPERKARQRGRRRGGEPGVRRKIVSAVYGPMLGFFPELFSTYYSFSMEPLRQGGFSARTGVTPVKGILQFVRGGKLLKEDETIAAADTPYLWTRTKLAVGTFV